eukprot:360988-Chlamydomonas_euryale.AAC.12
MRWELWSGKRVHARQPRVIHVAAASSTMPLLSRPSQGCAVRCVCHAHAFPLRARFPTFTRKSALHRMEGRCGWTTACPV